MRRAVTVVLALAAAGLATPPAFGSYLVDRNAKSVKLQVDSGGHALVSYVASGAQKHVLVWGAVDALPPTHGKPQVAFKVDYSGGWKALHKPNYFKTIKNVCRPYKGPKLAWFVTACTAPDGTSWALQAWQRRLPHRGVDPWVPTQTSWELRISHWSGPLAVLEGWADWAFGGQAHDLFGRYTYLGAPIYAARPGDTYARNLYIDTLDSRYGAGWKRETSVLSRRPNGNFCYAFYPTRDPSLPGAPLRPAGNGTRYRITAIGPGVTPDVVWEGAGLPDFDPANATLVEHEREMNALVDQIAAGDPLCLHH
jgi:hypothetical protein